MNAPEQYHNLRTAGYSAEESEYIVHYASNVLLFSDIERMQKTAAGQKGLVPPSGTNTYYPDQTTALPYTQSPAVKREMGTNFAPAPRLTPEAYKLYEQEKNGWGQNKNDYNAVWNEARKQVIQNNPRDAFNLSGPLPNGNPNGKYLINQSLLNDSIRRQYFKDLGYNSGDPLGLAGSNLQTLKGDPNLHAGVLSMEDPTLLPSQIIDLSKKDQIGKYSPTYDTSKYFQKSDSSYVPSAVVTPGGKVDLHPVANPTAYQTMTPAAYQKQYGDPNQIASQYYQYQQQNSPSSYYYQPTLVDPQGPSNTANFGTDYNISSPNITLSHVKTEMKKAGYSEEESDNILRFASNVVLISNTNQAQKKESGWLGEAPLDAITESVGQLGDGTGNWAAGAVDSLSAPLEYALGDPAAAQRAKAGFFEHGNQFMRDFASIPGIWQQNYGQSGPENKAIVAPQPKPNQIEW
jgi:hypothetical protein